jgi:hypothetical protein
MLGCQRTVLPKESSHMNGFAQILIRKFKLRSLTSVQGRRQSLQQPNFCKAPCSLVADSKSVAKLDKVDFGPILCSLASVQRGGGPERPAPAVRLLGGCAGVDALALPSPQVHFGVSICYLPISSHCGSGKKRAPSGDPQCVREIVFSIG